jgi:hypothetical protein
MRRFFMIPIRHVAITLFAGAMGLGLYGCQDTGSIDPGPQLAGLSVSSASLQPPFASETTGYIVDLPSATSDLTVSATKSDPNDVLSGAITAPAGQATGQTTISPPGPGSTKDISLTVTSPDGRAKIYTMTLRAITLGGDNTLRSLTLSPGTLSPPFSAGTQNYRVNVATVVAEVTVSATKSDANAMMFAFGSVIAAAGTQTGQVSVPLSGKRTDADITVTAQDGVSSTPYTITIIRARR